MHRPDLPLAHILRVLECELQHSFRGFLGDEFYGLDDAVDNDVFDARVFAFGVFADEDCVDVVVGGFVAGDGFAGTDVCEEVECAAEGEIEGDVAFADGCLHHRNSHQYDSISVLWETRGAKRDWGWSARREGL